MMFGETEFSYHGADFVQTVLGSSVPGAAHLRAGLPCQDYCGFAACEDGTIIMAAADGHGSSASPHSAFGARFAVNVFLRTLKEVQAEYAGDPGQLMTYLNREGSMKIAQTIEAEWKRKVVRSHLRSKRRTAPIEKGSDFRQTIQAMYGTTLLGLMIAPGFVFAYQLGDGDICHVAGGGIEMVLHPEKILGVETHSMGKPNSWKKVNTIVRGRDETMSVPSAFILSTDGFTNSHASEEEYQKSCFEYFDMLVKHGPEAVAVSLPAWLAETSELGCGDDITLILVLTRKIQRAEDSPIELRTNGVQDEQKR